jgi:putative DNA methylase
MSTYRVKSPRKLIEVALPLDAINEASAREKAIRQGHPSTLHLWWARRPLAAARAVLFAQLVNDPGYQQGGGFKYGMEKKRAAAERKRLFAIIEDLVQWKNTTNESVLERARAEITRSWREVCDLNKDHPEAPELFNPERPPAFHDPFAGGGTIPLEAQRLGLEAYASDLNPVAVLICKAMIEIPPRFAGQSPVHPEARRTLGATSGHWSRATGLAEDVRHYGQWIREEAHRRIGSLYPPVEVTETMVIERPDLKPLLSKKLNVIAWLWARTVKSPNPAFSHVDVPLASSFIISSGAGKEAYVQPIIQKDRYRFTVKLGRPPAEAALGTTAGKRKGFRCLISNVPIGYDYIRREGKAGRIGQKLMAVVAEGPVGRIYLSPTKATESPAYQAAPAWMPMLSLPENPRDFKTPNYGLNTYSALFTPRQLVALNTISDLVREVGSTIAADASLAGFKRDPTPLEARGNGATAYGEAVTVYLALAFGKILDYNSTICSWIAGGQTMRNTFGRQAIPMVWDFAEANPIATSTGSYWSAIEQGFRVIRDSLSAYRQGYASQADAQTQTLSRNKTVSTDPPYYDNIGYAELSDYFYIWLRKTLHSIYPSLWKTIAVPKADELVATPYRHGSQAAAESFFLSGMTAAMSRLSEESHPEGPITIYYAFKQSEVSADSTTSSTGWETFLEAVNRSSLQLSGTWPIRTELGTKVSGVGHNMLASSIILVCRKRPMDAPTISRREFLRELNSVLPEALDEMTNGAGGERSPVAPVDLSQAIIGPGMSVFSKYTAVLEADGSAMTVRTAMQLINRFLAEDDFDHDTRFCLHWFEQYSWNNGPFGEADVLARAKGTSVEGVKQAGVIVSGGGKVRLLKWSEYPEDWDPSSDARLPIWEALHQLIRAHRNSGDAAAGRLLAGASHKAEGIRQLAYRLYTSCERAGWAEDARAYNEVITSWSAIESTAVDLSGDVDLFGESL